MEKYAVPTSDDPKLASNEESDKCPNCGAELESTDKVNVRKCPDCGTLPFEDAESSNASQR